MFAEERRPVNSLFNKVVERAADAGTLAKSLAEGGVRYVTTAVNGIEVLGSIYAFSSKDVERDETHYLLIPFPHPDNSYVVYTKRVIPPGVGITNSLPKARIFHVPDASGQAILEKQLITKAIENGLVESVGQSDFADRLETLAEQIDQQTEKVSGGLLLIGGAVAFVNPLLGIGIAAKGLLPSVGAKATKAGASLIGDKLRAWNKAKRESRSLKEAKKNVRRLKPQVYTNPLIQSLDAIVTNESDSYDPLLDERNWIDAFDEFRYFEITLEAISEVYSEIMERKNESSLSSSYRSWIKYLVALRDT